ncbi:hypothetical protein C922_01609 [Plasmodium inui San Antonio 1]|uniref:Uncharacterized protein n=1 Tax=Plasmodium inui San Antonio 1 TaxID=1237626 RepID=W7A3X9_9APIC|nr:hypothetical protein C922_01609 [Plasmodium inui San Antonio 1]EUD67997.1 hypothetical protein C922_01609 [Plasmodium inui San Antonio 1]
MENGKDKHCYPPEHCNPYRIFNSITKCYRCNGSDVESFILNEEGIPLNNREGHNHATAKECPGVLKGEHACGGFLCKRNFQESVNIHHADRRSASTLAKRREGTSKDDIKLFDIKYGISSYAYLGEKTSHVLQTNGPFCGSVRYTSNGTPTNGAYIPRVNFDEKIKLHNDLYVYVEECGLQRETSECTTKPEPRSTRSSLNTSLSENKPFKYTSKKDHLERVDNTSSIYHPDDKHTYVYDNLKAHNGARDELTLKKMKTAIHLGDKLKEVSRSVYLENHSEPFGSSETEEHDEASPCVEDKQLTRHKESNSNNHENWGTCTDGVVTPKGCKNKKSCSMIHFATEGTNVQPQLVDNFSQTVGKKKKIVKMKRRLKIGLKGRRKKKTKNAFLKKPGNGKKLRVNKTKKMKATCSRKRIPMSRQKEGYAHKGKKKRNKLGSKNAKNSAPCKFSIGKGDKKVSSDMRNRVNNHLAQVIYSKLHHKEGKNKRRESEPPIMRQTKFANRKSHTHRIKIKNAKAVKRDEKLQEVEKNSIDLDEAKNLITHDDMQSDDVEEASIIHGEVNSDEINIVSGRDSDVSPSPKVATKSVGSGSYYFCLSDDVSNSSYRSFLVDTHSLELSKITQYSDRTVGVHGSGMAEEDAFLKSGRSHEEEKEEGEENKEEENEGYNHMAKTGKENLSSSNPENGTNLKASVGRDAKWGDLTSIRNGLEKDGASNTKKSFNGGSDGCNFISNGGISAEEMTSICRGEYTTFDENEERLTFVVLRQVANFLGGGSGDVQSGETLEEGQKSFNIDREGRTVDQLRSNPQIEEPREDGFFCEMVTSTSGVRGRIGGRNRSDDSFFEKAILNSDEENSALMDTCTYRQSCQKDKNLFMLHSNLLKQRSFFHQHGTLENEVMYILNSLTFYSHKLKNVLNYAIGRKCPNGDDTLQVKLLTLCLINLTEKAKRSGGPSSCLKSVSILMHQLLGRVRYGVLSLSKNGQVTKFEQVIMKTYLIELIKMCRLLLTSLGGIKNPPRSSFAGESRLSPTGELSFHNWAARSGVEVPEMGKLKTSLEKHLVCNSEDRKVFQPDGNGNEDTTDRVKGEQSGVVAVEVNSMNGDMKQISKLTNEVVVSQNNHPTYCDIYKLIKGLKEKLLLLERNSQTNFCSLRLMLKYLDKLSYIYRVNSALLDDPKQEKIPTDQMANQMDDQIRRMVQNVQEKITAWTRGNEAICDMPTLYSIKSVQKGMEKNVFAFFDQLSGKDSHGRRPIGVCPRVPKQNGSVELEGEKMAHARTNSVRNECHRKQMRGLHKGGKKKTSFDNSVESYHDETEHLERLNECLNEVILSKNKELITNPNGHYAMLKEYKEELSVLNDLRNGENGLVNDFLDHMPSWKFTKMLSAYVRGGIPRRGNSEWGRVHLGTTQNLPTFSRKRNKKKISGLPLEGNLYRDAHAHLSNEECLNQ